MSFVRRCLLMSLPFVAAALLVGRPASAQSMVLAKPGTLLLVENPDGGGRVVRVTPLTGKVEVIATSAGFGSFRWRGLALAPDGSLYVVQTDDGNSVNSRNGVYRISATVSSTPVVPTLISDGTVATTTQSFSMPRRAVVSTAGELFVSDNGVEAIFRVDTITGARTVISSSDGTIGVGSGRSFSGDEGLDLSMAFTSDGTMLVADRDGGEVIRVDTASGTRALVVSSGITEDACDLAELPGGSFVVVGTDRDGSDSGVWLLRKTANGFATSVEVVADNSGVGSGPRLNEIMGVAVDSRLNVFVVGKSGGNELLRVDLFTGNRTVLAGNDELRQPVDIVAIPGPAVPPARLPVAGDALVTDGAQSALFLIDSRTGDREYLSTGVLGVGEGPTFSVPRGIALTADGRIVVTDSGRHVLFAVDLSTGDRTILSGSTIEGEFGSGPGFANLRRVAVARDGAVYVTDRGLRAVLRIDLADGARSIVSTATGTSARGTGPDFAVDGLAGIAVGLGGELYVADRKAGALLRIDPGTGDRLTVSSSSTGQGPAFSTDGPVGVLVRANGRIFTTDAAGERVIAVDPATGDRTIVSGGSTGTGTPFANARDLAAGGEGVLLAVDATRVQIIGIEEQGGDRGVVAGSQHGTGPNLADPLGIAVIPFPEPALAIRSHGCIVESGAPTGAPVLVLLLAGLLVVVYAGKRQAARHRQA